MFRSLPTSMEYSTATNSSFPAKLLLVTQSSLTINDFAVQAEMTAVETYIVVGNILWIFYDCLSPRIFYSRLFLTDSDVGLHLSSPYSVIPCFDSNEHRFSFVLVS